MQRGDVLGIEKQLVAEKVRELQVKEFLNESLKRVGYSNAEIKRTPLGTRIILHVIRPGRIIGRGGTKIKSLTNKLAREFNLENPHIEVKEVEVPELDSVIMAKRIASSLERGYHFKRVAHRALSRILELGATGAEICVTGKIPGKRSRCWKFIGGYIKHCGEAADTAIKQGMAVAYLKPGVVGIKVRIMPPGVKLPDAIVERKQKVKPIVVTETADAVLADDGEKTKSTKKPKRTKKPKKTDKSSKIRDVKERLKEEGQDELEDEDDDLVIEEKPKEKKAPRRKIQDASKRIAEEKKEAAPEEPKEEKKAAPRRKIQDASKRIAEEKGEDTSATEEKTENVEGGESQ